MLRKISVKVKQTEAHHWAVSVRAHRWLLPSVAYTTTKDTEDAAIKAAFQVVHLWLAADEEKAH